MQSVNKETDNLQCLSNKVLINKLGENPGNQVLYDEFYRRFHAYICGTVLKICNKAKLKRATQPQDIIQEVYLRLFEKDAKVLREFRSDNKYAAFTLLGMMCNQVVLQYIDKYFYLDFTALREKLLTSIESNGYTPSELNEEIYDCIKKVSAARLRGERDEIIFLLKADGIRSSRITRWLSDVSESRINNVWTEYRKMLIKCLRSKGIGPRQNKNGKKT